MSDVACIDLSCGAGGLTHGLIEAGVPVVAGIDVDAACRYPFETNNAGSIRISVCEAWFSLTPHWVTDCMRRVFVTASP